MAAYQKHGVDLPVDLEHRSVNGDTAPDATDARGWFRLEVRQGELWAVDVKWTPDGAARLANRTQRYISPCFTHDEEGRISEVINVALVSMPATHEAPALVAASKHTVVVGARVATALRAQLYIEAARRGTTASKLIAAMLRRTSLAAAADDPEAQIADLCAALGISATSTPENILAAVSALLQSLGSTAPSPPGPAAPKKPPADPAPKKPPPPASLARLTASERATLAARGVTTDAQFTALKKTIMRRA
jgi:phage I-like protein